MKPYSLKYYKEYAKDLVRTYWKAYVAGFFSAMLFMSCATAYAAHMYEGTVWPPIYKWNGAELMEGQTGQAKTAGGEVIEYEVRYDDAAKVVLVFAGPYMRLVGVGQVYEEKRCAEYWIDYGVSVGDKMGNYKALADWGSPDWKLHLNDCAE